MSIADQSARTGRIIMENDATINEADMMNGDGIHTHNYYISVTRGLISGASAFVSHGERTSSGAETEYPIWPDGEFSIPADAGVQMSFVSTSANDTSDGTGVRQVSVHYLDANLAEQNETITLNGLTTVLSVATNIRFINDLHAESVGSGLKAAGNITASNGGITYAQLSTNFTRQSSSFKMIPVGKVLHLTNFVYGSISGAGNGKSIIKLVSNQLNGSQYRNPLILFPYISNGFQNSCVSIKRDTFPTFSAGAVIGVVHTSDKAVTVTSTLSGWLENA